MLPSVEDAEELFNQVAAKNISLGTLTDVIAYALDLNLCEKQALLDELDVDRRARTLLGHLQALVRRAVFACCRGRFPPGIQRELSGGVEFRRLPARRGALLDPLPRCL